MDNEMHLPWDRPSLEALIRKVISTGEASKIDLKSNFELSEAQQQGEFLKDISAIANTYNHYYRNHGFIIFGARQNNMTYCNFSNNEDHLQATIDDLIKKYLGPFIITHLFIFTEGEKKWGVLVIPPTKTAPHVFISDIHKRCRGDVYVRSGTTTTKAHPDDYVRFFRQHLEEHTYEFQQSINDLQREVSLLKSQIKKIKTFPTLQKREKLTSKTKAASDIPEITKQYQSISEQIDDLFAKEEDVVTKGLLTEAKKINDFLESSEIPWAISSVEKTQSKEIFSKIESVSNEFWSAVISIVLKDDKGIYDEALVKAITYLARMMNAPSGVSYTELGKNVRYYPLLVALYIICIVGVAKKRDKLLKRILKINLQGRSRYEEPLPITYILFFIRSSANVFQPLYDAYPNSKWCDPVASYTKSLIDRILNPDDLLWDKDNEFYRGEYVLCIAPMDILEKETKKPMIGHPSSGLFLFIGIAEPIIVRLLKQDKEWLKKVFERPLEEILKEFDNTAHLLINGSGGFGGGFEGKAFEIAFPEKVKKVLPTQ